MTNSKHVSTSSPTSISREKLKELVLRNFQEVPPRDAGIIEGSQIIDSKWYAPLHGCDTLDRLLKELGDFLKDGGGA
jgi:hypothetical protein